MLGKLVSRKLVVVMLAIAGNVGIVLGLAIIDRDLLIDAKEVILLAVAAITGLGGYQVTKQAEIDREEVEAPAANAGGP